MDKVADPARVTPLSEQSTLKSDTSFSIKGFHTSVLSVIMCHWLEVHGQLDKEEAFGQLHVSNWQIYKRNSLIWQRKFF